MEKSSGNLIPNQGTPCWVVEGSSSPATGWCEDDPTPEQAMEDLASLARGSKEDFRVAMDGIRKSGEAGLARLRSTDGEGVNPTKL